MRTTDQIIKNKDSALKRLQQLLNDIYNEDPPKADKLSYWIKDYVMFRRQENTFLPNRLKHYKRGDVIKANFGFRIGAEIGGSHYCIVLNNCNSTYDPLVTVLPLISLKKHIDVESFSTDRLYLGSELHDAISSKCYNQVITLQELLDVLKDSADKGTISPQELKTELSVAKAKINENNKIVEEVGKMKFGSIALLSQVTTISKMRIQDPRTNHGVLSGIRISDSSLDEINRRLEKLYIHNSKKQQN